MDNKKILTTTTPAKKTEKAGPAKETTCHLFYLLSYNKNNYKKNYSNKNNNYTMTTKWSSYQGYLCRSIFMKLINKNKLTSGLTKNG